MTSCHVILRRNVVNDEELLERKVVKQIAKSANQWKIERSTKCLSRIFSYIDFEQKAQNLDLSKRIHH